MQTLIFGLSAETLLVGGLVLPLFGFIANGLLALSPWGSYGTRKGWAVTLGVATPALSFVAFAVAFFILLNLGPREEILTRPLFEWIGVAGALIPFQLKLDSLSGILTLVVTGVGSLIHVYSIGYMKDDAGTIRYFSYLNLFIFAMLLLVLGANLPLLFIGWEGVGLTSYLLIGFWFEDLEKAKAGKKAFIVNRIGDAGFLIGMLLIFRALSPGSIGEGGPWAFATLSGAIDALRPTAPWIALALFVGAVGKSAQIPLYIWLPDAMAGPTPVSALIHAATMVTAGVYLVCRLHFLFAAAPLVMNVVAVVGISTAAFAATMGLVAKDIKKVLAYSTISQLGMMMAAAGVGAFGAAIFHLVTHAFFKACLFLGAGSVIHAVKGNQDIWGMGGLGRPMKATSVSFLAASLALAGIAPLAGFFSKDEILFALIAKGHIVLWAIGLATGALTAFYTIRLFALTFSGTSRLPEGVHPHEAPLTMTVPVVILGCLSVLGGILGIPHALGGSHLLHQFLGPLFEASSQATATPWLGPEKELLFAVISLLVALHAAIAAWILYTQRLEIPARLAQKAALLYRILAQRYWVDEIYDAVLVRPLVWISERLFWRVGDELIIDGGLVHGPARLVAQGAALIQKIQTGLLGHYALIILCGALGLVGWFVLR